MSRKVAIVQSNYIPWKGYFDLINLVDIFILFDHVQYTRRDWRNRNKIKTPNGPQWLSIPVEIKGKYHQKIMDVKISDPSWKRKHWRSIVQNYSRAGHFRDFQDFFAELYLNNQENYLSQINYQFIRAICSILKIDTEIAWSSNYSFQPGKNETLIDLCKQVGATEYFSGPAAKAYLDENLFRKEGITVQFIDYSGYPEYRQLFPPFDHQISIIDLIFNEGPAAPKYLKSF